MIFANIWLNKKINVDKYTKIILTAIAVNLTILTLSNVDILPKVHANDTSINYANNMVEKLDQQKNDLGLTMEESKDLIRFFYSRVKR
jgi:hypothetical protein